MDGAFHYIGNDFATLPERSRAAMVELIAALPSIQADTNSSSLTSLSHRISSITLDGVQLFKPVTNEQLISFSEFWRENDYLMIENALISDAMSLLKERIRYDAQKDLSEPNQFYRVHNDDECRNFISNLLQVAVGYYKLVLSTDLIASYAFAMKYIKNSDMHPHYDNYNNPISSTICYQSVPERVKNPLYVDRARFSNPYTIRLTVRDRAGIPERNVVRMDLKPGDIGIFRGRNHLHWRDAILEELDYRAILLHFCDYKYKGAMSKASISVPNIAEKQLYFDSYDEFRNTYIMYFEKDQPAESIMECSAPSFSKSVTSAPGRPRVEINSSYRRPCILL